MGINGFHRSEAVNLTWDELCLMHYGAKDNYGGKRRMGPIHAEAAALLHSRWGPCCWESTNYRKAKPILGSDSMTEVLPSPAITPNRLLLIINGCNTSRH